MRLDKYLKVSRLIKRRTLAKITSLLDSTKKADASFMYEFIGETTR